jgi:hypothetical protein
MMHDDFESVRLQLEGKEELTANGHIKRKKEDEGASIRKNSPKKVIPGPKFINKS